MKIRNILLPFFALLSAETAFAKNRKCDFDSNLVPDHYEDNLNSLCNKVFDSAGQITSIAEQITPILSNGIFAIVVLLAAVIALQIYVVRLLKKGTSLSVVLLTGMMAFGGLSYTPNAYAWGAVAWFGEVDQFDYGSGNVEVTLWGNGESTAVNYPTKEAASSAALFKCRELASGNTCFVIGTFENTCGSTVQGYLRDNTGAEQRGSPLYFATGNTPAAALSAAETNCQTDGNNVCEIQISRMSLGTDEAREMYCDGLPAAVNPVSPPQEAGTDIANVGVSGLGNLEELVVYNQSANAITYSKGDYLEPKDGDFQRMIITERIVVAAGELTEIPVACRQRSKSTPALGATFYSMPRAIQLDENSACQVRCLDSASVQSCVWACEGNAQADDEFTQTSGGGGGGGGSSGGSAGAIIGGVAVVGGLIWLLSSGGEEGEFNFSPDFGYSATESGYSANAGGRMDFHKDNWNLYYTADSDFRRNGSLEFRYTSGGTYTADFWTAAFSESVQGETADYDFSLSANLRGGIWNVSPVYRLHSEYENGESETDNSLNLEGVLRYNRWTISPSAGFRWENADNFGDNARFRLDLVRNF